MTVFCLVPSQATGLSISGRNGNRFTLNSTIKFPRSNKLISSTVMAILEIVYEPQNVLHPKAKLLTNFNPEFQLSIDDMTQTFASAVVPN